MLKLGADIEAADSDGKTALMWAENEDIVKLIEDHIELQELNVGNKTKAIRQR